MGTLREDKDKNMIDAKIVEVHYFGKEGSLVFDVVITRLIMGTTTQ